MKKSNHLSFAFVLLAGLLASPSQAAILYRGRLTQSLGGETRFDAGASYPMVFRLYRLPQGGEAFFVSESRDVAVDTDGSFETVLDDPAIDGAFKDDCASVYVGLTLDGGRELMPRRQILMLPNVEHATQANGLAANPAVASLEAQGFNAGSVSVGWLSAKHLKVNQTQGAISMQKVAGEEADGLDLTSNKVSLFGEQKEIVTGKTASSVGETLADAPADGVAVIFAVPTSERQPICTGVVRFCRKGDAIAAPTAAEPLTVRFYSFVTR